MPHGFENIGEGRAHVIELTTSDRFVRFREESAALHADPDLDADARDAAFSALARRYGMRFGDG